MRPELTASRFQRKRRVWKGTASSPFAVYVWEIAPEQARFEPGRTYIVQARRAC